MSKNISLKNSLIYNNNVLYSFKSYYSKTKKYTYSEWWNFHTTFHANILRLNGNHYFITNTVLSRELIPIPYLRILYQEIDSVSSGLIIQSIDSFKKIIGNDYDQFCLNYVRRCHILLHDATNLLKLMVLLKKMNNDCEAC